MERKLYNILKAAFRTVIQVNREKATAIIEFEVKELENIFSLLVLGGFAGLPSPPTPIAVELFPYMERELTILLSRTDLSQDPLATLVDMLQID